MTTLKRYRWFWPWQDEKEEAWLEKMSEEGWHLKTINLPGRYFFASGTPSRYAYRLDYMPAEKDKFQEYQQIFQDAGWEYIGEMSGWRYWRKPVAIGETAEIFSDAESKLKKYLRLLGFVGFFLLILIMLGTIVFRSDFLDPGDPPIISAIYFGGRILYVVIIPIYVFVAVQLLRRINQLKKKIL